MTDLLVDNKVELGARCLGRGAVRRIECDVVPDGIGHGPRAQNRGELARVLDRPVLGAKAENRASLFGSDARKLEELSGICEVDSHSVRHGRLLHQTNARTPELYPSVLRETLDRQLSDVADVLDATQTSSHWIATIVAASLNQTIRSKSSSLNQRRLGSRSSIASRSIATGSAREVVDQIARDAVARGQAREVRAWEPARVLELLGVHLDIAARVGGDEADHQLAWEGPVLAADVGDVLHVDTDLFLHLARHAALERLAVVDEAGDERVAARRPDGLARE